MAFVVKSDNEDSVCFYVKDTFGETHIIEKFIERGNVNMLRYYIKKLYHPSKKHSKESVQKMIYM